jgi:hypothetical protein
VGFKSRAIELQPNCRAAQQQRFTQQQIVQNPNHTVTPSRWRAVRQLIILARRTSYFVPFHETTPDLFHVWSIRFERFAQRQHRGI